MRLTARPRLLGSALSLALLLTLLAVPAVVADEPTTTVAAVPDPTVTGPIGDAGIHGYALWDSWYDLSEVGYTEDEYFISGSALHNTSDATADYTTRIIVTRPIDPDRFSGTVLLDWVNVTAQFENAVGTLTARDFLLREGWAYVHVSAQAAGVCCTPLTPKVWDPVRYADLDHPGDSYANNIFSQVAKAIRAPVGTDPMDGLEVQRVLATGQSQSGTRLRGYVNTEHPRAGVIDGFLVHGDYPPNKTFGELSVPVIQLLADSEASSASPNRTENYRLWEVAGAAHSDLWIGSSQVFGQGPRVVGGPKRPAAHARELDAFAGNYGEQPNPLHPACIVAGAAFPTRYALNAALHHLDRWAAGGPPAPEAPRYEFSGGSLARDGDGNALGGLRLPPIDVPVARYVSTSCVLGGITVPFTELELLARYPTHADYYRQLRERTVAAVDAGFLLAADAADLLERACAMRSRWGTLTNEPCEGLRSTVPAPTVGGPVEGGVKGAPYGSPPFDLAEHGYVEEEYLISGRAAAYDASPVALAPAGAPGASVDAPYTTRIVVRRPADAEEFNGTVLMEWFNVTSGYDVDPDWVHTHTELLRSGYAYVGVTAQLVGATALKAYDPLRYAALVHPGDSYAYDIFAQAAKAVRAPAGQDPLGGLAVERVLAAGSSQSGSALNTYVNAVHPRVEPVIDGFLIDVMRGTLRDDLDVPVLRLLSEGEAGGGQPDSDHYRHWEVAGSSHADAYVGQYWEGTHSRDWGVPEGVWPLTPRDREPPLEPLLGDVGGCTIGHFPRHHVTKAALDALHTWVRDGTAPPIAPRITVEDGQITRDEHGNALGGIRLPGIEVPIATYTGDSAECGPTLGKTEWFGDAELAELYPTPQSYTSAVNAAAGRAVGAGFLLPADAQQIRQEAAASGIGG